MLYRISCSNKKKLNGKRSKKQQEKKKKKTTNDYLILHFMTLAKRASYRTWFAYNHMRICTTVQLIQCGHTILAIVPCVFVIFHTCQPMSFTITRQNMAFIAHNVVIFTMFLLRFLFSLFIFGCKTSQQTTRKHKAIVLVCSDHVMRRQMEMYENPSRL